MDRRKLLERIVSGLGEYLDAERASLFCVDGERGTLRMEVAPLERGPRLEVHVSPLRGIVGHAWLTARVVRVDDAYADPRFCADVDRASGFRTRSLLAVPIHGRDGDVVGVLELLNRGDGGAFSDHDVAVVRAHEPELRGLLEAGSEEHA